MCTYIYTYSETYSVTYSLTRMCTHAPTRAHTHTCMNAYKPVSHSLTRTRTRTHTRTHTHTRTRKHTHTNTNTHTHTNTHTRHLDLGRRNDPRGTRGAHTRALTHTPSLSCVLCVCVRVCVRARTHTRHCHLGGSPDPRGVVDEGPHRVVLGLVTRGFAGLWARVCSRFGLRVCGWRDASVCVCVCDCV